MLIKRPIYNQQLTCVAFEILSHQEISQHQDFHNPLFELITNSDTQLPLFIPFILKPLLEQFDTHIENPIILKLLANEIESIYPLEELHNSLFSIALLINNPQELTWLNFAEYIGLTEQLINSTDATKVVQFSRDKHRKVIAYGIDKPLNFDKCKAMNMDYYCGEFLFQPMVNGQNDITEGKLNLLKLIQMLQKENCDSNDISIIIQNDPLLRSQLLKIANSVSNSNYQAVTSIDQAITRLGISHFKNWIIALAMKNSSDKPIEILESGLIRAHMAQELAKKSTEISSQSAYSTGLLSILDCLLNKPIHELVNQIALTQEIKAALTSKTGPLGELLSLVIAYEEGHWGEISEPCYKGLDLSEVYINCLALVAKSTKALHS